MVIAAFKRSWIFAQNSKDNGSTYGSIRVSIRNGSSRATEVVSNLFETFIIKIIKITDILKSLCCQLGTSVRGDG